MFSSEKTKEGHDSELQIHQVKSQKHWYNAHLKNKIKIVGNRRLEFISSTKVFYICRTMCCCFEF